MLTVWEPFFDMMALVAVAGSGLAMNGGYGDVEALDAASEAAALTTAGKGSDRATATGLRARPEATTTERGVASFLMGSVSHGVLQHADRPVLVEPSPAMSPSPHTSRRSMQVPAPTLGWQERSTGTVSAVSSFHRSRPMQPLAEAVDLPAGARAAPDAAGLSLPSFRLRCCDVHPVRCDDTQSASSPGELVEWARAHGASAHGFTPAWYSPAQVSSMASAVTG